MKRGIKLSGDKVFILADQVMVSGSAFATNLLVARALGLGAYGLFSSVGLVQLFVLSLSFGATTQIYQVVYPSLPEALKASYTKGLFWCEVVMLTLLMAVGFLFYRAMPNSIIAYKTLVLSGVCATVLYLLQDFIRRILLTQQRAKQAFVSDAITNVIQLIFLAVCWYLHWLTITNAWWIIGITFIPSIAVGIFWIKPGRPTLDGLQLAYRHHAPKAKWLVSSALLQWCSGYFFVLTAGLWLGAAALGALRLAQYIFGLLNVLLQAIESYALPKAAMASTQLAAYLYNLLNKSLLIMLPVLLLLSVFARPILGLAGGDAYKEYSYIMYGLSLVYVLITVGCPLRIAMRSRHLDKHYFIGYILSVTFSISAAPWLLKNWQLYGVMAGLVATQVITLSYWGLVLQQKKIFAWKSSI